MNKRKKNRYLGSLKNQLQQLRKKFEIEKNLKNKAYYFILSNGFLESFSEFNLQYRGREPHDECINWIVENG